MPSQTAIFLSYWVGKIAVADPGFLKGGASQEEMTDVQSQKSAKELPNMHASASWVSSQGTTDLLTDI